jgi:transcriptional regulator with XRE-family HTH domain
MEKKVFRSEIAKGFREAIKRRDITLLQAARDLGVSRQALHAYLRGGATPRGEVLRRACKLWGLTLNYKGLAFGSGSFGSRRRAHTRAVQLELPLRDALENLGTDDLDVKLLRADAGSIELQVRIKLAS